MKQTKITKSARGQECQIRIPEYCNGNNETVVYCHINGAGVGRKASDLHGAYGCNSCHSIIDGHANCYHESETIKLWFLEAVIRTQLILLEKGLIKI